MIVSKSLEFIGLANELSIHAKKLNFHPEKSFSEIIKEVTGKVILALRPSAKRLGRDEICSSSSDDSCHESGKESSEDDSGSYTKPGWEVILT